MENHINLAPFIFLSAQEDGTLLQVNEMLCSALGYEKHELVGKKIDILLTLPSKIFQQTHFFPLLKMHGHAEEIFISFEKKNKEELPLLINAEKKMIDDEPVYLYAGIIVQHRQQYENELIAAKKAAEEALNKNTALQNAQAELQKHGEKLDQQMFTVQMQNEELLQFHRVLTHDMSEPLRKLLIFVHLLKESTDREKQQGILDKVLSVSKQLKGIVSALQKYAWLTEHTILPRQVKLQNVLALTVHEVQKEFQEVNISVDEKSLPEVMGDAEQLRYLFYELFANSVRFRKKDEELKIIVTANTVMLNKFKTVKEKYSYTQFVKIDVTDNGNGFNPAYKEEAFQLFRKFHLHSGRGIGLSLCKKIVESHDGRIKIDSTEGKGTTVTIFLPVSITNEKVSQEHLKLSNQ